MRAIVCLIAFWLMGAAASAQGADCLGAGETGGRYHAFAERLTELADGVELCTTDPAGSVENLDGLRTSRFDFALAQNDLAYHHFYGNHGFPRWREFSAVAPLFPEYVQVFVRNAAEAPTLLGDLRGLSVNLGQTGSGSYYNAREVMDAAGLREGIDYRARNLGLGEAFTALENGEIDALFVTAAANLEFDPQRVRRLALPPMVVSELSAGRPYYESGFLQINGAPAAALAVRAYLFTRSDAPAGRVAQLSAALIANWDTLSSEFDGLLAPDQFLLRASLPVHRSARGSLVDAGHANPQPQYWMWMLIWAALLAISFIAVTFETTYDRTGVKRERRGRFAFIQVALDWWARPSPWIIGLSLFALLLLTALLTLRSAETAHAQAYQLDNPFADLTLSEGFIWMLTFVASGFTENNAYPLSTIGRVLVAILAFIGVGGPIAAIIIIVNMWGRRRSERIAGLMPARFSNHVLVCGWNEHLDGVVYALTGNDAEHAKKVCIVAESGDASPLATHHFDQNKVSFRRGDSADRDTLEKAGAREAGHAIILADYDRRSSQNIGAILTAMNLKRLNPDIHISAELAFSQNADHFAAFGCATLITPDIFVAKAAALSTIHPNMIDYLLEVLTYDAFDELYSIRFEELCAQNPDISLGMTNSDLESALWSCGANLVGLVCSELRREAVYDAEVVDGGPIISLTRAEGYAYTPKPDDRIIYAAARRKSVMRTRDLNEVRDAEPIPRDRFQLQRSEGARILLYASRAHLERLEANLRVFHQNPTIHAITIEDTPFLTSETLNEQLPASLEFDHVILLADAAKKRDATSSAEVRAVDASTLLATKLIAEHANRRGWPCKITAEVLDREDRDAFMTEGAGAHVVIPSTTLVERFLVKDVFDGNAMLDFLIAVMNMRDGTHLYMHTLEPGDPLIGHSYASLIRTRHAGLHLVGWLPVTKREELRNRAGDFAFHFRTAYDERIEQKTLQAGDLLVFTACLRIWDGDPDPVESA